MKQHVLIAVLVVILLGLAGCMESMPTIGGGSRTITGSAGEKGAVDAQSSIPRCSKPIGTATLSDGADLSESDGPYAAAINAQMKYQKQMVAQYGGLPNPLPLLKLTIAQSNCFKIIDRSAGLSARKLEKKLQEQGLVKVKRHARVKAVEYVIVAEIASPAQQTGGVGGAFGGYGGGIIGLIGGALKKEEAQVTLTVIPLATLESVVAEGHASSNDVSAGVALLGLGATGFGLGGWSKNPKSELYAAAFVHAMQQIVPQLH